MPRGKGTSQTDIYPQILLIRSTEQSAADAYESFEQPIPVPRFGGTSTRPFVFEIIRIFWNYEPVSAVAACLYQVQLSTVPLLVIADHEPRVFFRHSVVVDQTVTSSFSNSDWSGCWDYTDGQGHGLLIGTDNIYLGFDTTATSSANNAIELRIEYRIKTVSASEYIGIVQSQQ